MCWESRRKLLQVETHSFEKVPTGKLLPFEERVHCYKDAPDRFVWLVRRPSGELATLKGWPNSLKTRCRHLLRIGDHQKHIRGTQRLLRHGILTPRILQSGIFMREENQAYRGLYLEYVPGVTLREFFEKLSVDSQAGFQIARMAGALTLKIALAGLFHSDYKLDNLIVSSTREGHQLWVIDTVVRHSFSLARSLARMLVRLERQQALLSQRLPAAWVMAALVAALKPLKKSVRIEVLRQLREVRTQEAQRLSQPRPSSARKAA